MKSGWNRAVAVMLLLAPVVGCQESVAQRSSPTGSPSTAAPSTVVPSTRDSVPATTPLPVPLHRRVVGQRPLRMLVVGDSVGASFAPGLRLWAGEHGNAEVLDLSRSWCALGRTLPMSHGLGIAPPGSGCDDWGTRWATNVEQFDPDVVFVYFSIWEVALRQLPGRADPAQPGDPALDAWQLSEYQAAADVLSARGATVVWFTIPCSNEPIERGSPLWHVNRKTIPRLAASRPAVAVVDLDHELCHDGPSDDYAGVHEARPDGGHYSETGAFAVAKWVMPIVLGDRPNPQTTDETEDTDGSASPIRTEG